MQGVLSQLKRAMVRRLGGCSREAADATRAGFEEMAQKHAQQQQQQQRRQSAHVRP